MSESSESVRVTFFTKSFDRLMPETTYTVPILVLPSGLNEIVNSVLQLEPAVPMDFLIDNLLLTKSLEKYLKDNSATKSREDVLMIEYTPSLQYSVQQRMPHNDWVSSVRCVQPGTGIFVTGSYDMAVRVWSVTSEEAEPIAVGQNHVGPVKEVCVCSTPTVSHKNQMKKRTARPMIHNLRIASGAKDGTVAVWDYQPEKEGIALVSSVQFHSASVETITYDFQHSLYVSGSWDKSVCVWGPEDEQPRTRLNSHARAVTKCRTNSTNLFSASMDGSVKIWDLNHGGGEGSLVHTLHGSHAIYGMAVRDRDAVTGHTDGKIRVWDLRTRKGVFAFPGHKQWVYSVAYVDADRCVSTSEDATARLWDLRVPNGAMLVMDTQHTDGIFDVCTAGEKTLATASKDNTVKLVSVT
eukprot:PhF_6_TR28117/c0_g1_i2/m.41594/K14863/YTM1, WDR12; ribosome biogenesis protein YTM1